MGPLLKIVLHRVLLVLESIDFHRFPKPNAEMGPLLQVVFQKALLVLKNIDFHRLPDLMLRWPPSFN